MSKTIFSVAFQQTCVTTLKLYTHVNCNMLQLVFIPLIFFLLGCPDRNLIFLLEKAAVGTGKDDWGYLI